MRTANSKRKRLFLTIRLRRKRHEGIFDSLSKGTRLRTFHSSLYFPSEDIPTLKSRSYS